MNKMLVVVFDNEKNAFEGLNALKELHRNGDITLYASAVVSKDANGQLQIRKVADEGPIGTATGLLVGSLIGLLGGPIGVAIGASAGMLGGLAFDLDSEDVNMTFAAEVSNALADGTTAVLAEIDESWTVPVDTRLEALDGLVFRRLRYEVVEDQLARETDAIIAEYHELKAELKEATDEEKAKINASMDKLKHKAQALNYLLEKRMNETKRKTDAKINAIETQLNDAKRRRKEKLEKRRNVIKEEYTARTYRLKQASELIDEAFSLEKIAG